MGEVEPQMAVFECDESYFGGARKGKRGRGAAGKVCVFGILKRGGRAYALPVADATSHTLLTALKTRVKADSVVYTRQPGQLQHSGRVRVQASPCQPQQNLCKQTRQLHQRHREFLELIQTCAAQI